MSATPSPDPKEVLARLHWLKASDPGLSPDPVDWRAVTVDLYDALDPTLKRQEAGGCAVDAANPSGQTVFSVPGPIGEAASDRSALDPKSTLVCAVRIEKGARSEIALAIARHTCNALPA